MRTRNRVLAGSLATIVVVSGCTTDSAGDELGGAADETAESIVEGVESVTDTTLSGDAAEAVAKLQTSLDVVTNELENAADQEELRTAWSEVETRVRDAVVEVQAESGFDESDLQAQLDQFESELDESNVSAEMRNAWTELRNAVDELTASLGE